MKILQLVRGFDIGGLHGGAERFGLDLALELKRRGHDVIVAALFRTNTDFESNWIQILNHAGITVKFMLDWEGRKITLRYLHAIRVLGKDMRMNPVDICQSHYQVGSIAAVYLKYIHATKIAVRTAHITREWGEGIVSWFARRIFTDWIFPACLDQEIGVSGVIASQLGRHPGTRLFRRKPRIIHNAMKFQSGTIIKSPRISTKKREYVIGSVGRLTKQKGYKILLNSVPSILSQLPAKFLIIGDGEQRRELEDLVDKLGIRDSVTFTGQVSNVDEYLKKMDLFVLPSLWEGLPTVIMEAMYAGVPVVATNIPGSNELIIPDWNGWLACPGDSHSLAETILLAARSPKLCRSFVSQGKIEISKYSLAMVAREYEVLYYSLTESTENPGFAG